jgi:hypothetical protein
MADCGIWLRDLFCDSTTEAGEDEVVVLVAGILPDGSTFKNRVPSGHWNMNDGEGDENRSIPDKNAVLWRGDLPDGATATFTVAFMEIDGGNGQQFGPALDALAKALQQKGGVAGLAGLVLGIVSPIVAAIEDSDDYLGSVNVRLTHTGDSIRAEFDGNERCSFSHNSDNNHTNSWRLNGDGSNYLAVFRAGRPNIIDFPGTGEDAGSKENLPIAS